MNYTLDPQGLVQDVWILSRSETRAAALADARQQEAQAWAFDPDAQTWTKP